MNDITGEELSEILTELNILPINTKLASSAVAWATALKKPKQTAELNDITVAQSIVISYTSQNILKSFCHVIFHLNNNSEIGLIVYF